MIHNKRTTILCSRETRFCPGKSSRRSKWRNKNATHMILQNDGPYEAQDDGRFTIDNVRNVYVDQFDLQRKHTRYEGKQIFVEAELSHHFLETNVSQKQSAAL